MPEITHKIFNDALLHWRDSAKEESVKQIMARTCMFLSYSTFVLDPHNEDYILGMDHISMKFFSVLKNRLWQTELGMGYLISNQVHLREGFVDKSLNVEVFSLISKFRFTIDSFEFDYEELKKLVTTLCQPERSKL
jgi:hypothetical protein